ncbi:hypothetical protein AWB92_24110 [Mycobacterium sp. IEC1808]|uniref:hypothetical protein n=1 Tax=Mycobacterium sp. IEC1808 TaxID=1743230 RepID=UPI000A155564|nr:hypothetical protein [Mycobacterium sp. IEC1808]ORW87500.1 hypothetical protein AWB92_24110 [Mycobacterium sp. IEC1808]
MDTTQPWSGNAGSNFDALDFGDEAGHDGGAALDFGDESTQYSGAALDFGDESGGDNVGQSAMDMMLVDESAELADTPTEQRATDLLPEDTGAAGDTHAGNDELPPKLTTVTNPPETVSVTASLDGTIRDVELSADAARMTESELADEILVIADLARQQASSKLLTVVLDGVAKAMKELNEVEPDHKLKELVGDVGATLADRLEHGWLRFSSPEQATQAQAEVFATRYTGDDGSSPGR